MTDELEILKTVTTRLEKVNIPYMITGSIAMNYYAVPRMTRDIDIVIELNVVDVDKVFNIFKDDFYIDQKMIDNAISEEGIFNVIHNEKLIKIDFIIRKSSEYRKLEFNRRLPIDIVGIKMWLVSPEDLVISKIIWAKDNMSELQVNDIDNLLNAVRDIDRRYIEKWVTLLGLKNVYRRLKL